MIYNDFFNDWRVWMKNIHGFFCDDWEYSNISQLIKKVKEGGMNHYWGQEFGGEIQYFLIKADDLIFIRIDNGKL